MKPIVLTLLAFTLLACGPDVSSTGELTEQERSAYLKKGKEIAGATFTTLSGQLGKAMQEGGIQNAAQYCNLVAYPLVDSLSEVHNAHIRRTSLKVRNPKDRPDASELEVLRQYHQDALENKELLPKVVRVGEDIAFYAPISIQGACLSCHGTVGEDVSEEDYSKILALYPEDEAVGYKLGELRGMWSIRFRQ